MTLIKLLLTEMRYFEQASVQTSDLDNLDGQFQVPPDVERVAAPLR